MVHFLIILYDTQVGKVYSKSKVNLSYHHDDNLDLPWILNKLYQLGYHRVLLESGPTLIHSFFKKKLINEFYLFKSDKPLNSIKNIDVNHLISNLNNYFKNNKIKTFISSDKLINYY